MKERNSEWENPLIDLETWAVMALTGAIGVPTTYQCETPRDLGEDLAKVLASGDPIVGENAVEKTR